MSSLLASLLTVYFLKESNGLVGQYFNHLLLLIMSSYESKVIDWEKSKFHPFCKFISKCWKTTSICAYWKDFVEKIKNHCCCYLFWLVLYVFLLLSFQSATLYLALHCFFFVISLTPPNKSDFNGCWCCCFRYHSKKIFSNCGQ